MKYLILADITTAQNRSQTEATRRGCDGVRTEYWWSFRKHPTLSTAVLYIHDDGSGLTAPETAACVATLAADWNQSAP